MILDSDMRRGILGSFKQYPLLMTFFVAVSSLQFFGTLWLLDHTISGDFNHYLLVIIIAFVILRTVGTIISQLLFGLLARYQKEYIQQFLSEGVEPENLSDYEHDSIYFSMADENSLIISSKIINVFVGVVFAFLNFGLMAVVAVLVIGCVIPIASILAKKRASFGRELSLLRKKRFSKVDGVIHGRSSLIFNRIISSTMSELRLAFEDEDKVKRREMFWRALDIAINAFFKVVPVIFLLTIGSFVQGVTVEQTILLLLFSLIVIAELLAISRSATPFVEGIKAKESLEKLRMLDTMDSPDNDDNCKVFKGSVLENISLSMLPDVELVSDILINLCFAHDTDTLLARDGVKLSNGEQQRVLLARIIYQMIKLGKRTPILVSPSIMGLDRNTFLKMKQNLTEFGSKVGLDFDFLDHEGSMIVENVLFDKENAVKSNEYEVQQSPIAKLISIKGITLISVAVVCLFLTGAAPALLSDNLQQAIALAALSISGVIAALIGFCLLENEFRVRLRERLLKKLYNHRVADDILSSNMKHDYTLAISKIALYLKDSVWLGLIALLTVALVLIEGMSGWFAAGVLGILIFTLYIFAPKVYQVRKQLSEGMQKHSTAVEKLKSVKGLELTQPSWKKVTLKNGIASVYDAAARKCFLMSMVSGLASFSTGLMLGFSLYGFSGSGELLTASLNFDIRVLVMFSAIFGLISESAILHRVLGEPMELGSEEKASGLLNLVADNSIVHVRGKSGAGKTVLLKALSEKFGWAYFDHNYNSSFGVRFCTIFLVEGSPQLDFRRNLPASDLFGLVTHSRFLLSLSK
jgi:hypothetical protein